MDKLNTAGAEPSSDRQDASPSPAASSSSAHQTEHLRVQREFDFTMAMANLISELVRVMGWDRNRQPPDGAARHSGGGVACGEQQEEEPPRPVLRSIFQPRFYASPIALSVNAAVATPTAAAAAAPAKKKTGNGFKTRSDFASRSAYVEYVQENLKSGMMVRMLEDYEEVCARDEGEFRYSNDGSPPVQVSPPSSSSTVCSPGHLSLTCPVVSGLLELPVQDLLGPLAYGRDPGQRRRRSGREGDAGEGLVPDGDAAAHVW